MLQQLLKSTDHSWRDDLSEEELELLAEIDHEWDATSVVRAGAMALTATGLVLALMRDKKFLGMAGIALPYLFPSRAQKSLPAKTLRQLNWVRTRREIEQDKSDLRAMATERRGQRRSSRTNGSSNATEELEASMAVVE